MCNHKGAGFVLDALPLAESLIADRGYDCIWFRQELEEGDLKPSISQSSRSCNAPYAYDKML